MKSKRWNIYWALWLQLGVMAFYTLPDFLIQHTHSKFWVYFYNDYQDLVHAGVSAVLLVLTVYALRRFNGLNWKESLQFLGFKKPNFTQILIGLASCLPLLLYFLYRLGFDIGCFDPNPSWQKVVSIIVGAGFFEETFYRGFLFRLFRRNHSFISAAVISGLFWTFGHLIGSSLTLSWNAQGLIVHFIIIFIESISAALLFERGGNVIWGFMAAHIVGDLMGISFSGTIQFADMDIRHTGQFYLYAVFISAGLITWALSSRLLRKNTKGTGDGMNALRE